MLFPIRTDGILRYGISVAATLLALSVPLAAREGGLDLEELGVAALGELMESGELTATDLTRYYLDRIAMLDDAGPQLNAILTLNPDALEIAAALDREEKRRGPLHGIPVVLKANIDTGDRMPTTAGSLALAGHLAQLDAFLVARLREAGCIILGVVNPRR